MSNKTGMEGKANSANIQMAKFLEHWGLTIIVLIAILAGQVLMFFMNLSGAPWIWLCAASFALMMAGSGLILYTKIPAYRNGSFFRFGISSVPLNFAGYYRWGWRVFLIGVVLALCLLLPRP